MKKTSLALALIFTLSLSAFADSSWKWISDTRPFDILPIVAVLTLLVETLAINYIPKVNKLLKTFVVAALANLASFALPYLLVFISNGSYNEFINNYPSYIVGVFYGIITLAAELPIVCKVLKKDALSRKKLLLTIVASNIVTTVMVAAFERIFCVGRW